MHQEHVSRRSLRSCLRMSLLALAVAAAGSPAFAAQEPADTAVAGARPAAATSAAAPAPVYSKYRGVTLGASADEVHKALGKPSIKDKTTETYMPSDGETAVVYYDGDGKANAVVVTYAGADAKAPAPKDVLGADLETDADGMANKMVRYPEAGYWISYSKLAGENPYVIVTMKRIENP